MREQRLHRVNADTTYTLGSFRSEQMQCLEQLRGVLSEQRDTLVDNVHEVCLLSFSFLACLFPLVLT